MRILVQRETVAVPTFFGIDCAVPRLANSADDVHRGRVCQHPSHRPHSLRRPHLPLIESTTTPAK